MRLRPVADLDSTHLPARTPQTGYTALYVASMGGHADAVQLLIGAGANVEAAGIEVRTGENGAGAGGLEAGGLEAGAAAQCVVRQGVRRLSYRVVRCSLGG